MPAASSVSLLDVIDMDALATKYGAHSVMIGEKIVDGRPVPAIVFSVERKLPPGEVAAQGLDIIPQITMIGDTPYHTDVIEATYSPLLLRVPPAAQSLAVALQSAGSLQATVWQQCWNSPVPGGAQIAPRNANWVGTLGAAVEYRDGRSSPDWRYGFLTNYHVACGGQYGPGSSIMQPFGQSPSPPIGTLIFSPHPRQTNGTADVALVDSMPPRAGNWPGGLVTTRPHQIASSAGDLVKISASPVPLKEVKIPDHRVWKSGRTTGRTAGRVAGVGNFTVGYGNESVMFRRMLVITAVDGAGGDFSAPGDSGSLVLENGTNRPLGLLFAGGGGQTIVMPIEYPLQALANNGYEVEFYEM